jgi:hypothetical protein
VKEIFEYEEDPSDDVYVNDFDKSPVLTGNSKDRANDMSGFGFEL